MDFFNSLTLDLKMLLVGIAGCTLLALFSGNSKAEKRYVLVLTVLVAAGIYRFNQVAGNDAAQRSAAARPVPHAAIAPPKHTPLVSTSAK
jgi:hypothetical protein